MLPAYDAMITDEKNSMFRYPRRAHFIIDRNGMVRFAKVMIKSLDLLDPQEILAALKASGA
jgi:peroxiredoxin